MAFSLAGSRLRYQLCVPLSDDVLWWVFPSYALIVSACC